MLDRARAEVTEELNRVSNCSSQFEELFEIAVFAEIRRIRKRARVADRDVSPGPIFVLNQLPFEVSPHHISIRYTL